MEERYSIGQLQELTGATRRAIRFYISRNLLDPSLGAGRGHFYTARHLQQLRQICEFRRQGFSLEEIRKLRRESESEEIPFPPQEGSAVEKRLGIELPTALHSREDPALLRVQKGQKTKATAEVREGAVGRPFPEQWLHIPLKPGVELQLQKQVSGLSEEDVDGLIKAVLKFLIVRKGS